MTRDGRENDYEVEVMCDYVQWLKYAVHDYPQDAQMRAFGRKCFMITMQRLIEESARNNRGETRIIQDRMQECDECERAGYKQCRDKEKGMVCKFKNPKYGIAAITKNFGEEAFTYIEKYIEPMIENATEGGKPENESADRTAAI